MANSVDPNQRCQHCLLRPVWSNIFRDHGKFAFLEWEKNTLPKIIKLENVFVKHYAPNHMPDPKGEWSLKENNLELHLQKMFKSLSVHLHLGL